MHWNHLMRDLLRAEARFDLQPSNNFMQFLNHSLKASFILDINKGGLICWKQQYPSHNFFRFIKARPVISLKKKQTKKSNQKLYKCISWSVPTWEWVQPRILHLMWATAIWKHFLQHLEIVGGIWKVFGKHLEIVGIIGIHFQAPYWTSKQYFVQ